MGSPILFALNISLGDIGLFAMGDWSPSACAHVHDKKTFFTAPAPPGAIRGMMNMSSGFPMSLVQIAHTRASRRTAQVDNHHQPHPHAPGLRVRHPCQHLTRIELGAAIRRLAGQPFIQTSAAASVSKSARHLG